MSEPDLFCAACGLRVHAVWAEGQALEVVRLRETNADGMVLRHHLEPQRDRHDPVVIVDRGKVS